MEERGGGKKGRGKRGKKSKRECVERPKMPVKHQEGMRCDAKPTQAVFVNTRSAKHEHAKACHVATWTGPIRSFACLPWVP